MNKIPLLWFVLRYATHGCRIRARNVLGLKDANTVEINPKTSNPVIDIMPDQKKKLEIKTSALLCDLELTKQ
ncbi:MAG: hypothetical protein R3B55_01600 [Candidatus Paceibacterota bacterium]